MKVQGVGRMADNPRAVLISLDERPSDDDLRDLHEFLRTWRADGSSLDESCLQTAKAARAAGPGAEY